MGGNKASITAEVVTSNNQMTVMLDIEMDIEEYEARIRSMATRTEELREFGVQPEGLREMYGWHFAEMEREARNYGVNPQRFYDLYISIVSDGDGRKHSL